MQQRSEETRQHILDAALGLFSQNGYDATGVAEICQAAGISKGAFYHHFPSKQAVFLTLLENWLRVIDAGLAAINQGVGDVPRIFMQMTDVLPGVFQSADGRLPMFLEYWLHASRDEDIWRATIAPYQRYQDFFATLIKKGIKEGSIREVDPVVTSQAIVALAVGLLLQGILNPRGADWPQVIQKSMQLVLDSITLSSNNNKEVI